MKKKIITFLLIFSYTFLFSQALEVELPSKLEYKRYWKNFKMRNRFEIDFNNITKSNNEFWRSKADLRFNTGKYQKQHWNYLTKKIKYIEEDIYENKKGANNEIEYLNTYNFNSFGNITEKVHSYNHGNQKEKEIFTYNENQNIIEYTRYKLSSYTDFQYKLEEKQTFKYNKNQQLVIKEGSNPQTITYTYNTNNLISKIQYFGYESGSNSGVIAYSTDVSDKELQEYKNKLKNKPLVEYTFEYDSHGNKILEQKKSLERNKTLYLHLYEYNENDLLSKFIVNDYIFEYTYNDSLILIKEILTDTRTNEILKSINEYSNSGQLICNISHGEYGNGIYQTDFEYDENNNVILETNFEIVNDKKEQYYISQQEYDNNNRMVKRTSFGEYRWIEKYNYDELGRLLNYTRTRTLDNKTYDDNSYIYDKNGGLVESIWNDLIKRKIEYY